MRKIRLRNIRKKAVIVVLDPAIYKGGPVLTEPRRGSQVPQAVTIRGGGESPTLDASAASLPQVKALKRARALRVVAAPAAKPKGKAAKKAPKAKGSAGRRAKAKKTKAAAKKK